MRMSSCAFNRITLHVIDIAWCYDLLVFIMVVGVTEIKTKCEEIEHLRQNPIDTFRIRYNKSRLTRVCQMRIQCGGWNYCGRRVVHAKAKHKKKPGSITGLFIYT
mgnify:CR=1 FL=1